MVSELVFVGTFQDAVQYSKDVLHNKDKFSMTALMHAVASYQRDVVDLILANTKDKRYLLDKTANGNTVSALPLLPLLPRFRSLSQSSLNRCHVSVLCRNRL